MASSLTHDTLHRRLPRHPLAAAAIIGRCARCKRVTIMATTRLAVAIVIGLQIPPMRLLVVASVSGGIATAIGLIALMLLSHHDRIPGVVASVHGCAPPGGP